MQLKRNAQGEDIKALESALVGKPAASKKFDGAFENKAYTNELFHQGARFCHRGRLYVLTCYTEHQYLNKLAKEGVENYRFRL